MHTHIAPLLALLVALPLATADVLPTPYPPGFLEATWHTDPMGQPYIELTWEAPLESGSSALAGYLVHKMDPEVALDPYFVDASETSFRDNSVMPDGTYAYYVTAVNTFGLESAPSNPVFLSGDYPRCLVFGWTLGPPPNYVLQHGCLLPPPV